MVDEVEQGVVGPMQVLEHQDERMPFRHRLEEPAPRRGRLPLAVVAAAATRLEAGERPDVLLHPGRLLGVGDQVADGRPQLRARLLGGVGLEDPGLGVHHFPERPVGHPLAVRQRPALAPGDEVRVALDSLEELPYEPALADSRDPHQRDQLHRLL